MRTSVPWGSSHARSRRSRSDPRHPACTSWRRHLPRVRANCALAFQAGCRGFESRPPLLTEVDRRNPPICGVSRHLTFRPSAPRPRNAWSTVAPRSRDACVRRARPRGRGSVRLQGADGEGRGAPNGLCQISDHETQRDDVRLDRLSLARRHLRDQPVPARKEKPALVGKRDVRTASTAHPKVLSQLVKRRAESRG